MDKRRTHFKKPGAKKTNARENIVWQDITVAITQLAGLGEGAGEHDGKRVFVPCTTAGDTVKARVVKATEQFLRGELREVVTPSKDRAQPICKWFERCGGCTLQHLNADTYKSFKIGMLTEAVRKAGYDPAICSPVHFLPSASRRRVEFKVRDSGDGFDIGYFKLNSHSLVPIDSCPILSPALDACVAPLREWVRKQEAAHAMHAIRISETDAQLDLVIELKQRANTHQSRLEELLHALQLKRITVVLEGKTLLELGEPVVKKMGEAEVPLPPDIFLQASEEGERWLIDKVVSSLEGAKNIADLFCGIGTYSFPLAINAKVNAFELEESMTRGLSVQANKFCGVKLKAFTRNLYTSPLTPTELDAYDAIAINPPRDGAKAQVEQIARSDLKKLVMVSCNPATFTRDARILQSVGYKLTYASGLDQFVFSPYLEIVAVFEK